MSSKTSIFIKNLTILDAGILSPSEGPQGRSWYVDVRLIGNRDDEGILLDFGYAKKLIKKIIDDEFDHKLFVAQKNVRRSSSERALIYSPVALKQKNSCFVLDIYKEAIVLFDQSFSNDPLELRNQVERKIEDKILTNIDKNVSKVCVNLREHDEFKRQNYFHYTHSLKYHNGNCQRFHGHSNTVEVIKNGNLNEEFSNIAANRLNGCYLVASDYLAEESEQKIQEIFKTLEMNSEQIENLHKIKYRGSQGQVFVLFPKEKTIVMNNESTIENIADFIKLYFFENDKNIQVIAYEGIQKGAMTE